tara:strand:- start:319 stop:444 length:126 start_codon:yes stop_codon:yes gene_type:complete
VGGNPERNPERTPRNPENLKNIVEQSAAPAEKEIRANNLHQ